jgi:hypothetical protein
MKWNFKTLLWIDLKISQKTIHFIAPTSADYSPLINQIERGANKPGALMTLAQEFIQCVSKPCSGFY